MLNSIDAQIYHRAGFSVEHANQLGNIVSVLRRIDNRLRSEGKPTPLQQLREKRSKQVHSEQKESA